MTATTHHLPPGDPAYRTHGVAPLPVAAGAEVAAVSWPAILAGATTATALSLVLLLLGTGLQLSVAAPWIGPADGGALSTKAILWLAFTQLVAAGTGGYMAGRLRGAWTDIQADEVFFRDTAHGLLAWGVATIGAAALLTTVSAAIAGIGIAERATDDEQATSASMAASNTAGSGTDTDAAAAYYLDRLFRSQSPAASGAASSTGTGSGDTSTSTSGSAATALPAASPSVPAAPAASTTTVTQLPRERLDESRRIFAHALSAGKLDPADEAYLAGLVASHTGRPVEEARTRVAEAFSGAHAANNTAAQVLPKMDEQARANAARNTLWMVVALFIGAFTASVCALAGGMHQRRI